MARFCYSFTGWNLCLFHFCRHLSRGYTSVRDNLGVQFQPHTQISPYPYTQLQCIMSFRKGSSSDLKLVDISLEAPSHSTYIGSPLQNLVHGSQKAHSNFQLIHLIHVKLITIGEACLSHIYLRTALADFGFHSISPNRCCSSLSSSDFLAIQSSGQITLTSTFPGEELTTRV